MDICAFHLSASYLYFLCAWLDRESVFRQFDAVDAVERAPEHVITTVVGNKELVDAVGYALCAVDDNAAISKRSRRRRSRSTTYLVVPIATPYANTGIENILSADEVNIGRPHHSSRREVGRTCRCGEGCAHLIPLYKVFALEDRHVMNILRSVKVEVSVRSLNHSRVRNAAVNDGVVVGFLQCGLGFCATSLSGTGRKRAFIVRRAARRQRYNERDCE